jgi:predicted amidophosphoribosyltransferase
MVIGDLNITRDGTCVRCGAPWRSSAKTRKYCNGCAAEAQRENVRKHNARLTKRRRERRAARRAEAMAHG